MRTFTADQIYECPMCLGMYLLRENHLRSSYPHNGEFRIIASIEPGEESTRHYPGTAPRVDEVTHVNAITECPHSESELVHEELVEQFHNDFPNGLIEPTR